MPIGAHVSIAGGLSTAIRRAQAIGAECIQIHLSAPQRWQDPTHSPEAVQDFVQAAQDKGIGPNFAHAIYLINLASPDPSLREKSRHALRVQGEAARLCAFDGVVFHVGSGKGQPIDEAESYVVEGLTAILESNSCARILLENSAGSGYTLGARFEQIGRILERLDRDERLGICLDTAHALASGYEIRTPDGLDQMLAEIDQHVGLDNLRLIHANDSKAALGAARDRHENIGDGEIGLAAFERLVRHAALRERPWVLEVPGYQKEGPDLENVARLRWLAGRPLPTPAA